MSHTTYIEGTAPEIGATIFTKFCSPAVREIAKEMQASPQELAALYSGFINACFGSMAADFGQEQAATIAQLLIDAFKTIDLNYTETKH